VATDGCGVETIDFTTRERRASRKEDVATMARVADALSSVSFYWPIVSAADHPATAPLHNWTHLTTTLSSTCSPRL